MRLQINKLLFILILYPGSVYADFDYEFTAHIKSRLNYVSYDADSVADLNGAKEGTLQDYNLRLNSYVHSGPSSLRTEAEINGIAGSSKSAFESVLIGRPLLENDDRRLLNLSTKEGDAEFSRTSRLDRLFYRYQGDQVDFKIGRQAFSFGNGLAFSVLDIFNPFSPVAFDREYKIGEDIASLSYQVFPELSVMILGVGRKNQFEDVTLDSSSFGGFTSYDGEGLSISSVVAQHYGRTFLGAGLSKNIFDAILRFDISYYAVENMQEKTDFLVNIDKGFQILGKNAYIFLEYFKSSLGEGRGGYGNLNDALRDRLTRGELFTLGTDYLAAGSKIEITDRANFIQAFICNINDQSILLRPYVEIEPNNISRIRLGMIIPTGGHNTEYGGVRLVDQSSNLAVKFAQGTQAFVQYAVYF